MSTGQTISRAFSHAAGTAGFTLWGRIFRIQGGRKRRGVLHPIAGASRTCLYDWQEGP